MPVINKNFRQLRILGTRGIPAAHGGFETFAEQLCFYLKDKDWQVTVYCQEDGRGSTFEDVWRVVRRVRIPVATSGAIGTIVFDLKSSLHAARETGLVLTLGYNTAIFCCLYRLKGHTNLINMDGIEWHRQKWGKVAKIWFWLNERIGCMLGNHLVADHPGIKQHLARHTKKSKITTIAYGSNRIDSADPDALSSYDLLPEKYAILIARAEPENSILEVVRAWSSKHRGFKLLVIGKYADDHAYQCAVKEASSEEVKFPGAIYDQSVVETLRFFARFGIHGHQVGGTNPSLVEALGAGNAILAHDNQFNRWVAGEGGVYFKNNADCEQHIERLCTDDTELRRLKMASLTRHANYFTWKQCLSKYETLLTEWGGKQPANLRVP